MNRYKLLLTILPSVLFTSLAQAQGTVTIDHQTHRFVGTESTLYKGKYLTFHSWFNKEDADFEAFKKEYNIDPNYNGSRRFSNPAQRYVRIKNKKVKDNFDGKREVSNMVITGSPKFLFPEKDLDYSTVDNTEYSKTLAKYAANYFKDEADIVPRYYEPFNEPMVHARDFIGKGNKNRKQRVDNISQQIIDHIDHVNETIHSTPELADVKVAGFGSAFPEFEANNFNLWRNRFKKFIDEVGGDIDYLSLHLYDGSGVNNKDGKRSGSNSEAILDLIEAYSYLKLGEVKPYLITEYGRLVPDQPNYKQNGNYVPLVNAQAVRSQLHFVMNFIERGDNLHLSTPFTIGKSKPKQRYSKSSLWETQPDGSSELSQRKYFFEMWKDVKGDRVYVNSSNIDVQTQAFVEGKQLFVVLNNLNEETQSLDLNLVEADGVKSVETKRLMIFKEKLPELTVKKTKAAPNKIDIRYGETIVLTYNFKSNIKFNNILTSTKHYATSYLKPIKANQTETFTLKNIDTKNGIATLRLGIGRDHNTSLNPEIKINGKTVSINGDAIRGYDQHNRQRFFGVLEIPVSIDTLKNGENTVAVTFPDQGGHITSVIMQVQNADKSL